MDLKVLDYYAPNPHCVRGKSFVISGEPNGKNILYGVGKTVIVRDVQNPAKSVIYKNHKHNVAAAKYSPSGIKICSGDVSGRIRVWELIRDCDGTRIADNKEFQILGGEIRDLCWGPESKRIGICGEDGNYRARCVTADSGNNVMKDAYHTKVANSIDYKPTRPYKLVVGDDDFQAVFYEGPPFKLSKVLTEHSRFVNVVRFSPDGKFFATASSDGHVFLYDGKTADQVGELLDGKACHSGGIYAISWSPCSKEILTVSGDKSAKIWNVETKEPVVKFVLGKDPLDQQMGCVWVGNTLITLSLSGNITYLDRNNPERPLKVIYGHNEALSAAVTIPSEKQCHVSADISGKMLWWDTESGVAHPFLGKGHTNKVVGMCYDKESKKIISAGWDDTVKFTSVPEFDFGSGSSIALGGQPQGVYLAGKYVVVNTNKGILLFKDEKKVDEIEHHRDFQPVAVSAFGNEIAVAQENMAVKIYHIENDKIVDSGKEIKQDLPSTCISYSPDGCYVAVALEDKCVQVFNTADNYSLLTKATIHHMRIHKLSWSPNSQYIFSASMDQMLSCWDITTGERQAVRKAHGSFIVHGMCSISDDILVTVADDCLTQIWKISK